MSSASVPSLATLSCRVASNALVIERYLAESGRPNLSFGSDEDQELPYGNGFEKLQQAREGIMRDARLLHDLVAGPRWLGTILPHQGQHDISCLHIIDHFKLWSIIPLDGSLTYAEIAERGQLDIYRTRGALRHAMTLRIFCESPPGRVAHTALSKLFLDPIFHQWFLFMYGDSVKATSALREALERFGASTKANETATNIAFDTDMNAMEFLAQGARGGRFGGAMTWFGSIGPLDDRLVVNGYPWADLGAAKIVDVGGGNGHFAFALAEEYPKLSIVIQDQAAQLQAVTTPASLTKRVTLQEHNFFKAQPVVADAYMFRFILHDWDDEHSARILRALVPSLRRGAKLLLLESVMDGDPNKDSMSHLVSGLNMEMLVLLNGHERTEEDWRQLLRMADSRFKLTRIVRPSGSVLSVIEVTWVGRKGKDVGDIEEPLLANDAVESPERRNGYKRRRVS